MRTGQSDAFPGGLGQRRCFDLWMAVAPEIVIVQIIGHDQDEVRLLAGGGEDGLANASEARRLVKRAMGGMWATSLRGAPQDGLPLKFEARA